MIHRVLHQDLGVQNPHLAERVHIFSPFFYPMLVSKIPVTNMLHLMSIQRTHGYSEVASWTAKWDVFAKRFLVVPIHER